MYPVFELYNIFYFDKEKKLPKGLALYSDGSLYKARRSFYKDLSKKDKSIQKETLLLKSKNLVRKVQTIIHNYEEEIKSFPSIMQPPFHIIDGQEEFICLEDKVIHGYNSLCSLSYRGNDSYKQLITENYNEDAKQFWTFTKILQEIQETIGDFGQYVFTGKRIKKEFNMYNKQSLNFYLVKNKNFKDYPFFDIKSDKNQIIFSLGKKYMAEIKIIFEGNPFCCKLPLVNHRSYITDNMISLYIGFDKNGVAWCNTVLEGKDINSNCDYIFFAAEKIIFEEDEE